ncbi:hypothetical protein LCGC14_2935780 [marine sediment metagenome]|uniref:Uncharacterized protein n=1 Tax=marine sediment metagenome TaxID=412755 RepID=A0A0F8XJE2_9ZZZZ
METKDSFDFWSKHLDQNIRWEHPNLGIIKGTLRGLSKLAGYVTDSKGQSRWVPFRSLSLEPYFIPQGPIYWSKHFGQKLFGTNYDGLTTTGVLMTLSPTEAKLSTPNGKNNNWVPLHTLRLDPADESCCQ